MRAIFAIPGDLSAPTGGYGYARRVLRGAPAAGLDLRHLELGTGFPEPSDRDLKRAATALDGGPPGIPLLIDGLAYGVFPNDLLSRISAPMVALCHHPLALETGLSREAAEALKEREKAALAAAAAVITTSNATAAILSAQYGVPAEKMTVAPPGTDRAPRAPGSGRPGCAIVSVGSITPRKGHIRVVRALAGMTDADWDLRIVGATPDRAALDRLMAEIRQLGLTDRVVIAGPVGMTAVAAAYQGADLFVLASEYEGFGMAFAEAMSHGLPVLGLESEAVAEATLGVARLVAKEAFAGALDDMVRRPAERFELAEKCWRAAARLPRWPDTIRTITDVLRSVS